MFIGPRKKDMFIGPRKKDMFIGPRKKDMFTGPRKKDMFTGPRKKDMFIGPRKKDMFIGPRKKDMFIGPRKKDMFIGPRKKDMFIGPRKKDMFIGPRKKDMFIGPRKKDMFVGPRKKDMFIGPRKKDMFVGPRKKDMFIGPRKKDMFIGPRKKGMFIGPRKKDMFIGSRKKDMFIGPRKKDMYIGPRKKDMFIGPRKKDMFISREYIDINQSAQTHARASGLDSFTGLKTVSFNCHGLKSSTFEIKDLCSNHDIIFLQETWLFEQELTLLSNIHPEFEGCGVSGMDSENHLLTGRPFGGIGILWKKSISKFVKSITFDDSRLLGVQITYNQETFVFINVYLPFQCEDNYENYLNYLGKPTAVVEEIATSNIVVLCDFNAAKDTRFENELLLWCNSNKCMSDKKNPW